MKTQVKEQKHAIRDFREVTVSYFDIEAESEEKLLALFFKEWDNRHKYCNNLHYTLTDPEMSAKYIKWYSNVHNYANNGGDMW